MKRQGEHLIDPGSPPEKPAPKRNPLAPLNARPSDNPYDCARYLCEAFAEVLATMDEHDRADIARSIIRGDTLDWGQRLEAAVRNYMQDEVYEDSNV
jgi:hypothetical protein